MNRETHQEMLHNSFPIVLTAEDRAAFTMSLMTGSAYNYPVPDSTLVGLRLKQVGKAVVAGDLSEVKRTLSAQVAALDQMYHRLVQLAEQAQTESLDTWERYMKLALRTQAQSARTAAILAQVCQGGACPSSLPTPEQRAEPKAEAADTTPAAPDKGWDSSRVRADAPGLSPAEREIRREFEAEMNRLVYGEREGMRGRSA